MANLNATGRVILLQTVFYCMRRAIDVIVDPLQAFAKPLQSLAIEAPLDRRRARRALSGEALGGST